MLWVDDVVQDKKTGSLTSAVSPRSNPLHGRLTLISYHHLHAPMLVV